MIDGGHPDDERVEPRSGKGRARTMGAKAHSFTHRTKVFADGTISKPSCVTPGALRRVPACQAG